MTKKTLINSARIKVNQDGKEIYQLMHSLLKDNNKRALLGLVMKMREEHKNPDDYKFTCFRGHIKNATKEIPYMHTATYVFAQLKESAHEI